MKKITIILITIFTISCSSDKNNIDYEVENEKEILAYIAKNNLNAQKSNTGLYYVINEQGTGAQPISTSDVTVAYKGTLTNTNVFDESDADGITFNLQNVIPGWTEGITYFKEGGSGLLLIPSRLAYGNRGNGRIPGGSVLIFEIHLIKVK